MKELNEENFQLVSFKRINKGKEITCSYKELDTNIIIDASNLKEPPHPDLLKELESLKEYFADVLNISNPDKVTVSGVIIGGEDQKEAVNITGKIKCANEMEIGLSTPRIFIANDILGYEDKISNSVEAIKKELYLYLFKGKKSQLSMFEEEEIETQTKPI